MAKKPTIKTLTDGFQNESKINANIKTIAEAFDNTLSRDGSIPNVMEVDLDVADATLTNVTQTNVNEVRINAVDLVTALTDPTNASVCIGNLTLNQGDILYWDEDGCIQQLALGAAGQMLKVSGGVPVWANDIDTDNDTVGINVYENGVLRGENVRTIDYLGNGGAGGFSTNNGGGDVSVDLVAGVTGCLFEDTRVDNTAGTGNIGGEQIGSLISDGPNVTVIDFVNDLGYTSLETAGNLGLELTLQLDYTLGGGPPGFENEGSGFLYYAYYEDDGTTLIGSQNSFSDLSGEPTNSIGGTVTIPAGTRYIRTSYLTAEGPGVSGSVTAMLRKVCAA